MSSPGEGVTSLSAGPVSSNIVPRHFRPDIEGLRAIAVGLVVLFHAGFPWLPGGYVGVDVFFVISGFLITGLLIREVQRSGRLSVKDFYIRRIRRILPMSTLVLVATIVAAALWMTPTESSSTSIAGSWAALFAANWYFAASASDYFDTSTQTNPILHFWSLGVEEQFYVIWPLLLVIAILIARWRGLSTKVLLRGALVGLVLLCVVSFWWSVTKTAEEGQWAFFGLHTRIWELGIGGLLAFSVPTFRRLSRNVSEVLAILGAVLIAYGAIVFTEQTVFPGVAALMPVLGTALIIAAGTSNDVLAGSPTLVGYALAIRPMQWLGARSYNLYLWHWPILVFAAMWSSPKTFGGSDTSHLTMPLVVAVSAVIVALIFTAVTYRVVEQPLRHAVLLKRAKLAFPSAALMIMVVLVVASFLAPSVVAARESSLEPGRQALISQATRISDELTTNPFWIERAPCIDPVKGSRSRVMERWNSGACTFGDLNGQRKVALIGDSHADMWLPAMDKLGKQKGIKVIYMAKSACSFYELANYSPESSSSICATWANSAMTELRDSKPFDAVMIGRRSQNLTGTSALGKDAEKSGNQNTFVDDIHQTFEQLSKVTSEIVILEDPASASFDVPSCIERGQGDVSQCGFERESGLHEELIIQADEKKAAEGLPSYVKVEAINTAPLLCKEDQTTCPAVVSNSTGTYIVFRDNHHVPFETSQALVDQLEPLVKKALS